MTARSWYAVRAAARAAEVRIYDEIGLWGTTADAFAAEVAALDVDEITLHLNSPGGDAWDGVAIHNTLKDHKARVTVVVDGLAASAASLIAVAGQTVRMNRGAQLMVHDPSGLAYGPATDMREVADLLDKLAGSYAALYAAKAGGTTADWRAVMKAETWYTAAEAVAAGLADEMVDGDQPAATAKAWDLVAQFRYPNRQAAPTPTLPRRPALVAARATTEGNPTMPKTGRVDPVKLRDALGLPADATDDQVHARVTAAGLSAAPPAAQTFPGPWAATGEDPARWARRTGRVVDEEVWRARYDGDPATYGPALAALPPLPRFAEDAGAAVDARTSYPPPGGRARTYVDVLRQRNPYAVARAERSQQPPPRLFGVHGDRAAVTASGIDPRALDALPWNAQLAAAAEPDRAKAYEIIASCADPETADLIADMEYRRHPAVRDYISDCERWAATADVAADVGNEPTEADLNALFPPHTQQKED